MWDVVEPVERLAEWFSGAGRAELLSGRGLGRRQRMHGRWGRRTFQIDQTVIAYEPQRSLEWRHDDEWLDGRAPLRSPRQRRSGWNSMPRRRLSSFACDPVTCRATG